MLKILFFICYLFILAGCGGTDDGNSSTEAFTLSQSSINISKDYDDSSASHLDIQVSVQNASGSVYIFADASQTHLVDDARAVFSEAQTGTLTLIPAQQNTLAPGTYTGDVIIHACKDENCKKEYSGSPKTLKINYTITGPDYEISNNQVIFRMTHNNQFPEPVPINMTSSQRVWNNSAGSLMSDDASKWLDAPVVWDDKSGTATFNIMKQLPPGRYSTKVDLYVHNTSFRKSVNVTLIVDPEPFVVSTDDFRFILNGPTPIENQKRSVTVSSNSSNAQAWNISSDIDWVSFSQNSGISGQNIDVALNDNAKQLSNGLHTGFIFVKADSGNTSMSMIPVSIYVNSVENIGELQKFKLNVKNSVVDKQRSKLYVIDDITKTFYFIDLKRGIVEKYIQFTDFPSHFFITKDNEKLYLSFHIWHESNTSIIEMDLDRQELASQFLIDIYVENFAVTTNNKLIAGAFNNIYSYDIQSGIKTEIFNNIFIGEKLRLDDTENYLYILESFTFFKLTKFDISGMSVPRMTFITSNDVPSNFWITPDNSTIITSFGELFSSSLNRGTRIFNQGENFISMDFNLSNNTAVAISSRFTGTKLMTFSLNDFNILSESNIDADIGDSIHIIDGKTYLISIEGFDFDKFLQVKSLVL